MTMITLLDGGLGQELVKRVGDKPTPLWSTQVMLDHPGLVEEVHRDYFNAGASVATTNSYALLQDRLNGTAVEANLPELTAAALSEAKAACAALGRGRIAGSIGPLGASYRSDVHPPFEQSVPIYRARVDALAEVSDVIVFETVVTIEAARACAAAGQGCGKPVWIAMSVDDQDGRKLRSGEMLSDAVAAIKEDVDAVLVNCSLPEAMPAALEVLATSGLPYGAYANGFTKISEGFLQDKPTVDALEARSDLTPERYAELVLGWVRSGARIVGGCCETGPDHIRESHRLLTAEGYTIAR